MLKFALIKKTDSEIVYKYQPESGADFGVVSYDTKSQKCEIISTAQNDKRLKYAQKMFGKIREFTNNGLYPQKGIIAWG